MRALRTAGSARRQGDAALPREGRPRASLEAPVAVPSQGRSAEDLSAFFEGLLASEIRKGPSGKVSHLKPEGPAARGPRGSCGSVFRRREVGRVA